MKKTILLLPILSLLSCSGGSGGGGNSTPERNIQFTSAYDPCNITGACSDIFKISQSDAINMIETSLYNSTPEVGTQTHAKIETLEQLIDYDPNTDQIAFTNCDVAYDQERLLVKLEDNFLYIRETVSNLQVKPLDKCESILDSMPRVQYAKENSLSNNKEVFAKDVESSIDVVFKSLLFNGKKIIRIETNESLIMIDSGQNFYSAEVMSHIRFNSDEDGFKYETASVQNDVIYNVDVSGINLDEVDIEDRTGEDSDEASNGF